MSFTFASDLSTDLAKVRFHIGDTNTNGAYLEDATITALISSEGSVGGASIACIKYIISQLSSPDFKQDWMSVSNEKARMGFEQLLVHKKQEFELGGTISSSLKLPYRADSYQDSDESTYDGTP